jgi:raffinose/stachyose/melibiose transport system permease protein
MIHSKSIGYYLYRFFGYIFLTFIIVVSVFPILWVIMSSFKSNGAILSSPFSLPDTFNFDAYKSVMEQYNLIHYFINSVLIATLPALGSLMIYAMGAYVIAKYRFPGKNLFYALFTMTLLVPDHTKTQPIFSIIMNLNLYDTKAGLMLVYLSSGLAMSMFILRSTFMAIPKELNEAATIDGAGFLRTFLVINLPLAKSGLSTAGILMFLGNWNEYYYAALLTSSASNRTLPVALSFFNQAFSYDYTRMFAALTIVVLPGILLYMLAQEQVTMSVASSGIKG